MTSNRSSERTRTRVTRTTESLPPATPPLPPRDIASASELHTTLRTLVMAAQYLAEANATLAEAFKRAETLLERMYADQDPIPF